MGYAEPLQGHVESIARGITVANAEAGQSALANVNPIYTWVRLAQAFPCAFISTMCHRAQYCPLDIPPPSKSIETRAGQPNSALLNTERAVSGAWCATTRSTRARWSLTGRTSGNC